MSDYKIEAWDFDTRHSPRRLKLFAEIFKRYQERIDFKVSARGWCYLMEQAGFINKNQFDLVNELLNRCRKRGLLPVDFCAEDIGRKFYEIHREDWRTPENFVSSYIDYVDDCEVYYDPDWWGEMTWGDEFIEAEKFYIQLVVEKVDLFTLFRPVCNELHVPIANARGWQSIFQRAQYARRFKEAEDMGLRPVLLYCGDHDPDGLRISETLYKNLDDVKKVVWMDGQVGFNPQNMIIDRFGLNLDFIESNNLTWIDNLITGSGKDLASAHHKNHSLDYVQDYLQSIGARKCEANAIVVNPPAARDLCRQAILKYLGQGAPDRFRRRKDIKERQVLKVKDRLMLHDTNGDELLGWDSISKELRRQL